MTYLLLALPDRVLSGIPITSRVLGLRLLLSLTSVLLIYFGMLLLARQLEVPTVYTTATIFCVYCSQMLYGAIAHVCNDSLAFPAMIFFIWSAVRAVQMPSTKTFAILAATLSAGLLIKASFLFEVPVALAIAGRTLWSRATMQGGTGPATSPGHDRTTGINKILSDLTARKGAGRAGDVGASGPRPRPTVESCVVGLFDP